jgi:hypothetical protein
MSLDYASSWVALANRALARLGSASIVSLDDGSSTAAYVRSLFPEAVLSVYGEYDWKSAKKRVELAPLATTPEYGYDYAYQLPSDFVRLVEVDTLDEYSPEGQTILSNDTSLNITYIARPDDPTKIPGHIQHLLITKLAFLLSTPLTSNEGLSQRLMGEYMEATNRAKDDDSRGSYQLDEDGLGWYDEDHR